jgi:hypothetical protein
MDAPDQEEASASPVAGAARPRRWPIVVAVAAVAVIVLVAAVAFVATRGGQPRPSSVGEALRRFRATSTTGAASSSRGPPAGVYPSAGSGTEKLSLQADATHMGPVMPVTVTRDGARCWWFRIDYTSAHWQSWHYCLEGDRLLDLGGDVHQRFEFTVFHYDSDVTSVCDPVDEVLHIGARKGDTWPQSCSSGQGSSAAHQAGMATYLGIARLTVGGRSVSTYDVRWTRTTTGAQTGTSADEYWFATDTCLPVRHIWSLTSTTAGPGGTSVTYAEKGEWDLTTRTPRG